MSYGTSNQPSRAWLLVGLSLGTLLAWWVITVVFESMKVEAQHRHNEQMEEDARQWVRQDAARKMAAHEESLQRDQRHLREWETAAGGLVQSVSKNPDLSLQELLEQVAEVCAPTGTVVTVKVDRFTDFEITMDFRQPVLIPQMAQAGACLLQVGAPYLHSLRFFQNGRLVAELDRRGIESISDWSTASAATVEPLLLRPEIEAAAPTAAAQTAREESEPIGDFKRLRDAERSLKADWDQQMELMQALLKAQADAVNLADVRDSTRLQTKLRELRRAGAGLEGLRSGFLGHEKLHQRLLTEQNLDPLAVQIIMREAAGRYREEKQHVDKFFDALKTRQSGADYFLNEMQRQWGSWRIVAEGLKISFTSDAAKQAHDRGTAQWEAGDTATIAAMKEWSAWNKARTERK